MKIKEYKNIFLIVLLFSCIVIDGYAKDKKQLALKYYNEACEFAKHGKSDLAIKKFKQAIHYNRKLADAHFQLGLVYMNKNTINNRFFAGLEFEKAIFLDRDNVEYRLKNAFLFIKKDMEGIAVKEFKKIVEIDPDNYNAYYQIGLILEKDVIRLKDMINPGETATIYFRGFAEKDKDEVLYYYNKAIAVNPKFTECYYRLSLIYYEFGDIDDMIDLLEKAVVINKNDKNCHLFLGFGYYNVERYKLADEQFEKAMKLMSTDEYDVFNSINILMSPEEESQFDNEGRLTKKLLKNKFWQKRDPFFMTAFNERKLEHYSRIAYANLRFSVSRKNIAGWQTDQGKVYIRYGKPQSMYRTKPDLAGIVDGGGSPLITSKEVWNYPDFNYVFEDRSLYRRYEFAWGDRPENDYRSVYNEMIKVKPEYYQSTPKKKQLKIIADINKFNIDKHFYDVEVSDAVFGDSVYYVFQNNDWQAYLKHGVFLLDENWNQIENYSDLLNVSENGLTSIGFDKYLINTNTFKLKPGSYNLAIELFDLESEKRGIHRQEIIVDTFNVNKLQISDVSLAFDIKYDSLAANFSRNNLTISNNPVKKIIQKKPLFIYYEIYNLSLNENNTTSFKIDYMIKKSNTESNKITKFFSSLFLDDIFGDITSTYEYVGISSTEYQYQQIELNENYQGLLSLVISITDLNNSSIVEKTIEFEVIKLQ